MGSTSEKEYEKIFSDLSGGVISDLVDEFNVQSAAVDKFRETVGDVLDELGSEQKNLLVFIDELDRCRPTYAIELLERIKHLFNIDRLVFILSTDINQISHSICAVYGSKFDAKKYLQRFIDLDYLLKKPNRENYIESLFCSLSFNDYFTERNGDDKHYRDSLSGCCKLLVKRFDLSLREINLLLTRMRLILLSVPIGDSLHEPLIVSLLILREYKPDLYSKYRENSRVADEVIEYLGKGLSDKEKNGDYFCLISGYLIAPNIDCLHSDSGSYLRTELRDLCEELLAPYRDIAANHEIEDRNKIHAAEYIINLVNRKIGSRIDHEAIIDRIELVNRINT